MSVINSPILKFSWTKLAVLLVLTALVAILVLLPWGMPDAQRYFDPIGAVSGHPGRVHEAQPQRG